MIAVAGGETARRVLAGARQLAESAECHVLHSFDAPFAARLESVGVSAAAIDAYAFEQRDAEQKALDRLIAEAGFDGKLRPRVVRGDAVASAFREIEALDPDLVVVGKHDERARGDSSSELGSVALRLTFGASCDVLQIP
jgi:nucleotide-binding universal stress UspA family protein